jgi:hypothetical protein
MAACIAAAAVFATMAVVRAERLSDNDVKSLIERINNERDRFEDQLDGKIKRTILRGAGGEVHVERYLDDLQENVSKLKDRFKPEYAASAEVTTLLRQGSDIHRFMAKQPPNLDGASEWNRLSASLQQLAAAYGTSMPIAEGQQARRMNDREVRKAADGIANGADKFKKELDSSLKNDKTVDQATREAAVMEAESLKQDAKELASVIGDGRPASGEAKALLDRAAKIRTALSGRALAGPARAAWSTIESGLTDIGHGFGLPAR